MVLDEITDNFGRPFHFRGIRLCHLGFPAL